MIAKWIAQALLRGDDHLTLTIEELAEWQANGYRVSFGAPYGLHGPYMVRQIYQWKHELVQQLTNSEPHRWPTGAMTVLSHGNQISLEMPGLDFQEVGSGQWRVPLVPADPNHCLDAWAFDLSLSEDELQALRPLALRLTRRMLIRCEIKGAHNVSGKTVLWNEGRIALATLAGIEPIRQHSWFELASVGYRSPPNNAEDVDTEDCVEMWRSQSRAKAEASYRGDILKSKRLICKDAKYDYEIKIKGAGVHCSHFTVDFFTTLISVGVWPEGLNNLTLKLTRGELINLKVMIEESLGLVDVPLPVYPDIAMGIEAAQMRNEQENGNV